MSIRVRPPKAEDRSVWLTLFKGYIDFYQAAVPDDVIDTLWQRLMDGGEGLPIALLAVDATDRPVGRSTRARQGCRQGPHRSGLCAC